jgi:hypothetical protein
MSLDRRETLRVPESRLITEIFSERPFAASVVNVSSTGLYTVKPLVSGLRGPSLLQMEIPLPEASESVWATGEVVFEAVGRKSVGAGIRFVDMADVHRRLIDDLVEHRRRSILEAMLREIIWRKELQAHPSPFTAPPPPVHEHTVRMYLLPDA